MKTLMIQVLGVGLIPRGMGIAPKKEPFPATKKEIELIMEHGTLQARMRNPKTGKFVDITSKNFEKLWETFAIDRDEKKPVINRQNATPAEIPVKKEEPKPAPQPNQVQFTKQNDNKNQNKPKWEQKQEQKHDKPAEEPKKEEEKNDESFAVTTSSDKK